MALLRKLMADHSLAPIPETEPLQPTLPRVRGTAKPTGKVVISEPEPPPPAVDVAQVAPVQIGDVVIFHEMRGDVPAIVQKVYSNTVVRLWIFGAQSIYPVDGVHEDAKVIGSWSRV